MLSMLIPDFDLNKIYDSSMPCNWRKIDKDWYIMHNDSKACSVKQFGNKKVFYCSENDFFDIWYRYFTLDIDYSFAYRHLRKFQEHRVREIAERESGLRLARIPANEMLVKSVLANMNGHDTIAEEMHKSMLANIGIPMKQTILNIGKVSWRVLPQIEALGQFKGNMYSGWFDKKADKRLAEISEAANSIGFSDKIKDAPIDEVPSLLWQIGLEDEEVSMVMLYSYAQLDNCPTSLLDRAVDKLFGVDPISFKEWFIDDISIYYGLLGLLLDSSYMSNRISKYTKPESLTEKIEKEAKRKRLRGI